MADELVVGTVVDAEQQLGARAPALLLTLDHGKGLVLLRPDDEVEPGTLVS